MAGLDPGAGPLQPDADIAPGGLGGQAVFRAPPEFGVPVESRTAVESRSLPEFGVPAQFTGPAELAVPGRRRVTAFWREAVLVIVVTAMLTAGVKSFVVEAFRIPSGSMENTLQVGDRVLVNKLIYRIRGIARGDIVVFSGSGSWGPPPPSQSANSVLAVYRDAMRAMGLETDGTDYVKRVIGLPGDHVACCDDQGRITVNGMPLREGSYVYPGEAPSAEFFSVTVPPGRLWVMGDHRGDSADSRYHGGDPGEGTIPESAVVGRAFLVIWPPSQAKSLPIPATFERRTPVAAAAPVIPLGMGFASMLPLAWARHRVRGRLSAGRR
jgi:signal peptidase I